MSHDFRHERKVFVNSDPVHTTQLCLTICLKEQGQEKKETGREEVRREGRQTPHHLEWLFTLWDQNLALIILGDQVITDFCLFLVS